MRISTSFLQGAYDFGIGIKEYKSDDTTMYEIFLGDAILTLTKDEWKTINSTVERAMDFLDESAYLEEK